MAKSRLIVKIVAVDTCVVIRQEYKNGRWRYGEEEVLTEEMPYEEAMKKRDELEAEESVPELITG